MEMQLVKHNDHGDTWLEPPLFDIGDFCPECGAQLVKCAESWDWCPGCGFSDCLS